MILACRQLHKAYGIDVILEKITFHMEEREHNAITVIALEVNVFAILAALMLYCGTVTSRIGNHIHTFHIFFK